MILLIAGASHTGKTLPAHGNVIGHRLDKEELIGKTREHGCSCILREEAV